MHTNLDNYGVAELVDAYADLKDAISGLEERLGAVKARLQNLAPGREVHNGRTAKIVVGLSERSTLDKAAVEIALGKTWVAEHSKTTLVETWRVKRQPRILAAAA